MMSLKPKTSKQTSDSLQRTSAGEDVWIEGSSVGHTIASTRRRFLCFVFCLLVGFARMKGGYERTGMHDVGLAKKQLKAKKKMSAHYVVGVHIRAVRLGASEKA